MLHPKSKPYLLNTLRLAVRHYLMNDRLSKSMREVFVISRRLGYQFNASLKVVVRTTPSSTDTGNGRRHNGTRPPWNTMYVTSIYFILEQMVWHDYEANIDHL